MHDARGGFLFFRFSDVDVRRFVGSKTLRVDYKAIPTKNEKPHKAHRTLWGFSINVTA